MGTLMLRFAILFIFLMTSPALAQRHSIDKSWTVGIEFGEIPMRGSFKPGLSIGYHFNDFIYIGAVYQIRDKIERNGSSFNAQAIALDGLMSSSEKVGQRGYLQARIRPHRLAPYASIGFVFNDRDTETIRFDDRQRTIGGVNRSGEIIITQSRPSGLRPAFGLGYSYTLPTGIELFTEWSGWWMFGAPKPEVDIAGQDISESSIRVLKENIIKEFQSSPFNTYHVFQIGVGYTW